MLYRDEDTIKFCAAHIWETRKGNLGACFLHIAKIKHNTIIGTIEYPVYEMIRFAQEIEREIVHIARRAGCFNTNDKV